MKQRLLHPFLFPVFPVLSLFASNLLPLHQAALMALPIVVGVVGASALLLILNKLLRNLYLSGALVSLLVLLFYSYSLIYEKLSASIFFRAFRKVTHLSEGYFVLLSLLIFISAAVWLLFQYRQHLQPLNAFLNVAALAAVLLPAATLAKSAVQLIGSSSSESAAQVNRKENQPDIYYILLDGYPREDVLREVMQYDNSSFIGYLRKKGFYVADSSHSNYSQTVLSLPSILNMDYIQQMEKVMAIKEPTRADLLPYIFNNKVFTELKNRGYKTVSFDATFDPYLQISDTDIFYQTPGQNFFSLSYFHYHLISLTPVSILDKKGVTTINPYEKHRQKILHAFSNLKECSKLRGATFAYAHILIPHQPIVFGANGEPLTPDYDYMLWNNDVRKEQEKYGKEFAAQVNLVNVKVQETVSYILKNSEQPPVIILQSDHGSDVQLDPFNIKNTNLKERMANLIALYIPCADTSKFYPAITTVNTFRLLFSECFGMNLPLLPDSVYFSDWDHPYEFVPVNKEQLR